MSLLVILSSPSGGGKSTVIRKLLKLSEMNFIYSVSCTTRKPRPGETDGKDYYFLSEAEFKKKIEQNGFLEWEQVHGYYYGTSRELVEQWLDQGKIVLLDIDVNGGLKIRQKFPHRSISIFLQPPSVNELIERLKKRKTESQQEIDKRLERVPLELARKKYFDFVITNKDIKTTVNETLDIIQKTIKRGGNS
ncbi:guanylate kinase [candidate division KSB1 bacterium]|nr:guanylate kinase [candidate division KSB1 bacterium]